MFTKQDLDILRKTIKQEFQLELTSVKQDLKSIRNEIREEVLPIKNDLKTMKIDITHIRKNQKTIINFFDREYLDLRERVERIEEVLKISSVS
jgi:hypothetical protein